MTCETTESLIAHIDGQLSEEKAKGVAAHLEGCARCQGERRALETLTRQLQVKEKPDAGFVAEVMQGLDRRRLRVRFAPVLAVAAALGAAVFYLRPEAYVARGGVVAPEHALGFEAFAGGVPLAVGARVKEDAGLTFVIYNRGHAPRFFMLFLRDNKGDLHWFAPSYEKESDDPQSVVVAAKPDGTPLPEGTVLESPALGAGEIVALFSSVPLHVHEVEAAKGLAPQSVVETLPIVVVAK